MTYTKPTWTPVRTELNDPIIRSEEAEVWREMFPHGFPQGSVTFVKAVRGTYDKMLHRDWCQDMTCWCHR